MRMFLLLRRPVLREPLALQRWSRTSRAIAADVFELEPDYVYGKNRKPRLGYHKPEVFDPLSDQLYQSGYRDFPPTAIPEELKQVDALDPGAEDGAHHWPARTAGSGLSRARPTRTNPPGIEIEILQSIAKKHGWEIDIAWVNMATRFGPGGAGRRLFALDRQRHLRHRPRPRSNGRRSSHGRPPARLHQPFHEHRIRAGDAGRRRRARRRMDDVKARRPSRSACRPTRPMHEYVQAHGFEYVSFFQNYQVDQCTGSGRGGRRDDLVGSHLAGQAGASRSRVRDGQRLRSGPRNALEQRLGGQGEGDGVEAVHRRGICRDAQERRDQTHRRAVRDAVLSAVRATGGRRSIHDR